MAKGKLPKNIMPSFKPMAAMQQAGIEGQEHGEVDKAADTVAGLGWEATKKIIKKISSVFGGVLFKVIIVILIISILASILTSFLKDLDEMLDPTVGQTGEYIRKVSEVESKSFAKAYNYTTENILSALVSDGITIA